MFVWIRLQFWLWWGGYHNVRRVFRDPETVSPGSRGRRELEQYLIDLCNAGVEDGAIEDPWAELRDYWAHGAEIRRLQEQDDPEEGTTD